MKFRRFVLISALSILAAAGANAQPKASVVYLIKDHDLSVWQQPTNLWSIVGDVFLSPSDPKALSSKPGLGILFNGGRTTDIVSKQEFGDVQLHIEFIISKRSNSGVISWGLTSFKFTIASASRRTSTPVSNAAAFTLAGLMKRTLKGILRMSMLRYLPANGRPLMSPSAPRASTTG